MAVVGASLAGAAAALELSSLGLSTALIDKQLFPRPKCCGEGLSSLGRELLGELIGSEVLASASRTIRGYCIYRDDAQGGTSNDPLRIESDLGCGVDRSRLDHLLLACALRQEACDGYIGTGVRGARQDSNGVELRLDSETITARYVVAADGAQGATAARLGVPYHRTPANRCGVNFHLKVRRGEVEPVVSIAFLRELELYCTPLPDSILNVAVLADDRTIARLMVTGLDKVKEAVERRLKLSSSYLDAPRSAGRLAGLRRPAVWGRAMLVGDCCESLDPIGGMGMSHALCSSRMAAKHLAASFAGKISYDEACRRYTRERLSAVRPMRGFTRLVGALRGAAAVPGALNALARTGLAGRVASSLSTNAEQSTPGRMFHLLLVGVGRV